MSELSNSLPVLAAEIRQAHADVQEAAKTAAERAIAAGHMLLEARELVKHGEWLPWLRGHCALAERTAQLYMQLARKGVKPATVADLGLQAAAKALILEYGYYRPLFEGEEAQRLDWLLFALFLHTKYGYPVSHLIDHFDWLGRHDFKSPDEWLGPEGKAFVSRWASRDQIEKHGACFGEWHAFRDSHRELQLPDIEAELQRLAETDPEPRPASVRKRRRARARSGTDAS
jgi:hypothetical protein